MRSYQSHFARLIELVCEWYTKQNSQIVGKDNYRSGPAIFPREEKISALHTENIVASSLFSSIRYSELSLFLTEAVQLIALFTKELVTSCNMPLAFLTHFFISQHNVPLMEFLIYWADITYWINFYLFTIAIIFREVVNNIH